MAASAQTAGRRHAGAAQGGQRGANTRGAGKSDSLHGRAGAAGAGAAYPGLLAEYKPGVKFYKSFL